MIVRAPRDQFLLYATQYKDELRRCVASIAAGSETAGECARVRQITHILAGSAGFFGFDMVSKKAAVLESALLDERSDAEIVRLIEGLLLSLP